MQKKVADFFCSFVDFSKAFDCIPHGKLWNRLLNEGVHGKILNVLRSMYSKLISCVKTKDGITEFFLCQTGTRQGCMISPFLFILYLMELVKMFSKHRCAGVILDNEYPDVQLWMYADDICVMNDTVGRLQQQLDVMSKFCNNYGLKVNFLKTNVMVFRNGGKLRNNEKWYYDKQILSPVSYYKYLGIMFSSTLKWSTPLNTIAQQATKASISAMTKLSDNCGNLPITISLKIFDKQIVPILLYGSEIWGYEYRKQIENVQIRFCKRLLGVSSQTPNVAILGECGRRSLSTLYMTRCIKYWLKIIMEYDNNRYPKKCYKVMCTLDSAGKQTWATQIGLLLYKLGW